MKKRTIIGIGLGIGVLSLIAIIAWRSVDAPPADVSDLQWRKPDISPAQNAVAVLMTIPKLENCARFDTKAVWNAAKAKEAASCYAPAFAILERAATLKLAASVAADAGIPAFDAPAGVYDFTALLRVSEALYARAEQRRRRGDLEAALSDLSTLMRIGIAVSRQPFSLPESLVGMNIIRIAQRSSWNLLSSARDAAFLRRLQKTLPPLANIIPSGYVHALRGEFSVLQSTLSTNHPQKFYVELAQLSGLAGPGSGIVAWLTRVAPLQALFYKPRQTEALAADYYRLVIRQVSTSKTVSEEQVQRLFEEKIAPRYDLAWENAIGKSLLYVAIPALSSARKSHFVTLTGQVALETALAWRLSGLALPKSYSATEKLPSSYPRLPLDPNRDDGGRLAWNSSTQTWQAANSETYPPAK